MERSIGSTATYKQLSGVHRSCLPCPMRGKQKIRIFEMDDSSELVVFSRPWPRQFYLPVIVLKIFLQGACVLGINAEPVTIKKIECTIIDHGFEQGWITPQVNNKWHCQHTKYRNVLVYWCKTLMLECVCSLQGCIKVEFKLSNRWRPACDILGGFLEKCGFYHTRLGVWVRVYGGGLSHVVFQISGFCCRPPLSDLTWSAPPTFPPFLLVVGEGGSLLF